MTALRKALSEGSQECGRWGQALLSTPAASLLSVPTAAVESSYYKSSIWGNGHTLCGSGNLGPQIVLRASTMDFMFLSLGFLNSKMEEGERT